MVNRQRNLTFARNVALNHDTNVRIVNSWRSAPFRGANYVAFYNYNRLWHGPHAVSASARLLINIRITTFHDFPFLFCSFIKPRMRVRRCDVLDHTSCCRTASNNTIATAVARFRLRVPCIGIVMQVSALAASKLSGSPFVSRPKTRKSFFRNFTS
jgi:hypothetical protein